MAYITKFLLKYITKEIQLSEDEFEKIQYGLEVLMINLSKLLIVFLLSVWLHTFYLTVFTIFIFSLLRASTFGLHSKSSMICTGICVITHVVTPYIIQQDTLHISYIILTGILILELGCIYRYAPADTEAHPLIGAQFRKALQIRVLKTIVFIFVLYCVIPFYEYKCTIVFTSFYVLLSILPITYKILNRRYNNYELYE